MRLWVEPAVIDEIGALPGNMRQRVRRAIRDLELISVLAVRRRPSYNYDDLRDLLGSL